MTKDRRVVDRIRDEIGVDVFLMLDAKDFEYVRHEPFLSKTPQATNIQMVLEGRVGGVIKLLMC